MPEVNGLLSVETMLNKLRTRNLRRLANAEVDVCIVGAGINGAVGAAALAAQGVKVALIDKGDFGGATSSQSSNLAWGGIKYLETREFGLVWRLCRSRNHLVASYPSTVKETRFLTTIERGFRLPAILIFAGALLYWVIGHCKTRPPKYLSKSALKQREPLINVEKAVAGVEYSDCFLEDNDARFVFGFVRKAMNFGAIAANYVEAISADRKPGQWIITCRDAVTDCEMALSAKVLINACGPEADQFNRLTSTPTKHWHALSKGVHLIVDLTLQERRVLTFFARDGRLFFVMPMGKRTCIGTTDTPVSDPTVQVTDADRDFVLENANELLSLTKPLTRQDIIAERCGVRPLVVNREQTQSDWMAMSRKHVIEFDEHAAHMSIFGGKITDCIHVGNEIIALTNRLGIEVGGQTHTWYGEPDTHKREEFFRRARLMSLDELPAQDLAEPLSTRLWRRYGNEAFWMLERIQEKPSSGEQIFELPQFLRCEIEHAAEHEMIVKLEDFLRRRSMISLVTRHNELRQAPALREACEVLFGNAVEERVNEYFEARHKEQTVE